MNFTQKDHKYKTYIGTVDFTYQSFAEAGYRQVQFIEENGGKFNYNERGYMLNQGWKRQDQRRHFQADGC